MFSYCFEVDGKEVRANYANSDIFVFGGHWAVANCIYLHETAGAIFNSQDNQDVMIEYGWVPVWSELPPENIIDAYYKIRGFEPDQRN